MHLTKEEKALELEAIRTRLATRRRELYQPGGTNTMLIYNGTDLADAEWLMVELDAVHGKVSLTPEERANLDRLTLKRTLTDPKDVAIQNKLSAKHGDLTPDELVERDYLQTKQDGLLNADEIEVYYDLMAKDGHPVKAKSKLPEVKTFHKHKDASK